MLKKVRFGLGCKGFRDATEAEILKRDLSESIQSRMNDSNPGALVD